MSARAEKNSLDCFFEQLNLYSFVIISCRMIPPDGSKENVSRGPTWFVLIAGKYYMLFLEQKI